MANYEIPDFLEPSELSMRVARLVNQINGAYSPQLWPAIHSTLHMISRMAPEQYALTAAVVAGAPSYIGGANSANERDARIGEMINIGSFFINSLTYTSSNVPEELLNGRSAHGKIELLHAAIRDGSGITAAFDEDKYAEDCLAFIQANHKIGLYHAGGTLSGDFTKTNAPGVFLQGTALVDVDLSYSDLSSSYFVGVKGSDIRFKGANLEGVHLHGVDFENTRFDGAFLKSAQIIGSKFRRLSLKGNEGLEDIVIADSHFRRSDLSGVNANGAVIRNTRFTRCNLSHLDISGANVTRSHFISSNLAYAEIKGSYGWDYATLRKVRIDIGTLAEIYAYLQIHLGEPSISATEQGKKITVEFDYASGKKMSFILASDGKSAYRYLSEIGITPENCDVATYMQLLQVKKKTLKKRYGLIEEGTKHKFAQKPLGFDEEPLYLPYLGRTYQRFAAEMITYHPELMLVHANSLRSEKDDGAIPAAVQRHKTFLAKGK